MPAKVLSCTCKHTDQDRMYGKRRRVHTVGGKDGTRRYTCAVCNKTK